MLLVFAARFVLVVLGYLSLESYLDRKPLATAVRAGLCAVVAIWIDRQVLIPGQEREAAAAGSVAGIVAANYLMTWRRAGRGDEE